MWGYSMQKHLLNCFFVWHYKDILGLKFTYLQLSSSESDISLLFSSATSEVSSPIKILLTSVLNTFSYNNS